MYGKSQENFMISLKAGCSAFQCRL